MRVEPRAERRLRLSRKLRLARTAVALCLIVWGVVWVGNRCSGTEPPAGIAGVPTLVEADAPDVERDVDVHAGYGTWVDVYDFLPSGSARRAAVTPDEIDEMAELGVSTLYLQAAQLEDQPSGEPAKLVDPDLVAQILVRAHLADMRVVGWYLPRFTDVDRDLAHLVAISEFEVLGHRFDGVAVDIEWTADVPDHTARSHALVELSEDLRAAVGDDDSLGAIVLPPVQIEVVNQQKWPKFPWEELADVYDVWLPMGYWTERRQDSGYNDGWNYTAENVERLRDNLDDPDAVVHAIGGIGDEVTPAHADGFVDAVTEQDAIGGSIYDWSTLDPALSARIADDLAARETQPAAEE